MQHAAQRFRPARRKDQHDARGQQPRASSLSSQPVNSIRPAATPSPRARARRDPGRRRRPPAASRGPRAGRRRRGSSCPCWARACRRRARRAPCRPDRTATSVTRGDAPQRGRCRPDSGITSMPRPRQLGRARDAGPRRSPADGDDGVGAREPVRFAARFASHVGNHRQRQRPQAPARGRMQTRMLPACRPGRAPAVARVQQVRPVADRPVVATVATAGTPRRARRRSPRRSS